MADNPIESLFELIGKQNKIIAAQQETIDTYKNLVERYEAAIISATETIRNQTSWIKSQRENAVN